MAQNLDHFPSAAQLRDLSVEDLRKKIVEMRKEFVLTRFKHVTAHLEKTSDLKKTRRSIARMETVLREMETRSDAKS